MASGRAFVVNRRELEWEEKEREKQRFILAKKNLALS
jgi:hypothetical protein